MTITGIAPRLGVILLWLIAALSPANGEDLANPNAVPKAPPLARSMAIEVLSANYGHTGARSSCVVTRTVKSICNGKSRCVLNVEDELCPPPSPIPPELILTLTVQYKCSDAAATRAGHADKPFRLVLDCSASSH
jgi:hypothetical protein